MSRYLIVLKLCLGFFSLLPVVSCQATTDVEIELPGCAKSCVGQVDCDITTYSCYCSDSPANIPLAECVAKACRNSTSSIRQLWEVREKFYPCGIQLQFIITDLWFVETPIPRPSQTLTTTAARSKSAGSPVSTAGRVRSDSSGTQRTTTTVYSVRDPERNDNIKTEFPEREPGLSRSGKIGIGVGVPLGVVLVGFLIGLAYFLGSRGRHRPARDLGPGRKEGSVTPPAIPGPPAQKPELEVPPRFDGMATSSAGSSSWLEPTIPTPAAYEMPVNVRFENSASDAV